MDLLILTMPPLEARILCGTQPYVKEKNQKNQLNLNFAIKEYENKYYGNILYITPS